MRCIGFGEFEDTCEEEAGASHSPLWCPRSDDLRRAHLDERFKEIGRQFAAAYGIDEAEGETRVRRAARDPGKPEVL